MLSGASLHAAWHWWWGEITDILPALRTRVERVIVDVSVLTEAPPPGPITLRLPAAMVLTKQLRFPLAAARDLQKIVACEIERHSPLPPQGIVFDARITKRDREANRLEVELRITRRDGLDRAIAWCAAQDRPPEAIEVAGHAAPFRPLPSPLGKRRRGRLGRDAGLSLAVVGLGIAVILGGVFRTQTAQDQLTARVAEARAQARQVEQLRRELDRTRQAACFLPARKQAPSAIAVLTALAAALPDDSWLSEIEIGPAGIRLRGAARSASALIAALDQTPLFQNAQFRAPLTPGLQAGLERFDLSVELKP